MQEFKRTEESTLFDSIIKQAQDEDWLERKVRNPETGNEVKVKSLTPKLQEKYRPKEQDTGDKKKKLKSELHGLTKDYLEDAHGGSRVFDHKTDKDGSVNWTFKHEHKGDHDSKDDVVDYTLHPADKNGHHTLEASDSRGYPHVHTEKIKNHKDLKNALNYHPTDDSIDENGKWATEDHDEYDDYWNNKH